ncbi:outer membrane beta-barrel protein [Myroides sp. LJL119]
MNVKRKYIYGLVLFILFSMKGLAQEISISFEGYFNNSLTRVKTYDSNSVLGYSMGVGYRYYLNQKWSLAAEVAYQNSSLDFIQRNAKSSWSSIDVEGDQYILKYQSKIRIEQISYRLIQVPLTVQFETGKEVKWYVQTGLAIGVITGSPKSRITINELDTSGYYPQWDVELQGPNFIGYGHFKNISHKKEIHLQNRYSWLFETGVKQELGNKQSLYIGAFFNLGLNNLAKDGIRDKHPITLSSNYDNPIELNSIWTDMSYSNQKLKDYHIGIKLRYAFHL